MCLTFLYVSPDDDCGKYQLVLINNRDESYQRPTANASFWTKDILCSRDLQMGKANGTWLAISRRGRIANLLNILEPPGSYYETSSSTGRGFLALDFVNSTKNPFEYCSQLQPLNYNGFSLICLSLVKNQSGSSKRWNVAYMSNRDESIRTEELNHGFYGFGNSVKSSPFNKVPYGLQKFQDCLKTSCQESDKGNLITSLLEILKDRTEIFPDKQIQSQSPHLDLETQRSISSCFVEYPHAAYGTRTHTIILIDKEENVTFMEENLVFDSETQQAKWKSQTFQFQLSV